MRVYLVLEFFARFVVAPRFPLACVLLSFLLSGFSPSLVPPAFDAPADHHGNSEWICRSC